MIEPLAKTERKYEVRSSSLDGEGVFATVSIAKGEHVMPVTGTLLRTGEFDMADHTLPILQIDADLFLLAAGEADDYLNHSCDPNLVFAFDAQGKLYLEALRDIAPREELAFDYATCENDPDFYTECFCKSKNCRGMVTGFSRLDRETQEKLLPCCLPYIQRWFKLS